METEDLVILECTYSPPDYFNGIVRISGEGYDIVIAEGKATTRVNPHFYDQNPSLRHMAEDSIHARFLAAQLESRRPFKLSKIFRASRLHANGRNDVTVYVSEPARAICRATTAGVVITDGHGVVFYDSRKECVEKREALGELIAKHSPLDPVVGVLLNSSKAAIDDPSNALIHLYEIRDAVAKRFGGEVGACNSLGISRRKWSRLGKLANEEPLEEGRHRGKFLSDLRNATEAELSEAWTIARELVENYLRYLERQSPD